MNTGNYRWQTHGPRDYAEATALIALLPAEDRHSLAGKTREALEWIVNVFGVQSRASEGAAYLAFSRARLATFLHRSVRTVDRILTRLTDLGYIRRQRRQPLRDAYQTSLTFPGHKLLRHLYHAAAKKLQQIRPATKMAHNDLRKENKSPDAGGGALSSPSETSRTRSPDDRPAFQAPPSGYAGPDYHPSHRPWKAPDWMTPRKG